VRKSSNIPAAIVLFLMLAIIAYFLYQGMSGHSIGAVIPSR